MSQWKKSSDCKYIYILSPNFNEDDIEEWSNRSMMIAHEPIRSGLHTLIEITKERYYDSEDVKILKKKIDLLFKWYNEHFLYFVHHHHAIEEHVYFPWVASVTEKIPEKLSHDHGELISMLQNIKNARISFDANDGRLDVDNFKKNLKALHALCEVLHDNMIEHMNEEEHIVPALLRQYEVAEKDEKIVVDKIVKNLGLSANKIMLPWICDVMEQWGGPQKVKEFMNRIPIAIRCIKWLSWDSHYRKNNKNIIQKIKEP